MKKVFFSIIVCLFALVVSTTSTTFAAEGGMENGKKVELNENDKAELEILYKQLFDLKKKLVEKHMEYGIVTKEKGEMIIKKMDERYEKMSKEGFEKGWEHHHKHKCTCENKE